MSGRPDRKRRTVYYVLPRGRGPAYLAAYACFGCRVSFKRPIPSRDGTPAYEPTCPRCGSPLHEMGRSFTAPRKRDLRQWKKVEILWRNGFRFYSYRSYPDAEPLPAKLTEVEGFLQRNIDHPFKLRR